MSRIQNYRFKEKLRGTLVGAVLVLSLREKYKRGVSVCEGVEMCESHAQCLLNAHNCLNLLN